MLSGKLLLSGRIVGRQDCLFSRGGRDRSGRILNQVVVKTMGSLNLLAQASPTSGGIAFFLPIILIMVIFYVLLILPAQRQAEEDDADAGGAEKWG